MNTFSWYLLLVSITFVNSCYIWGTDSGYCLPDSLQPIWRQTYMPFCASAINFPICAPQPQSVVPTREHPQGRWFNHTVQNKDAWVQAKFWEHVNRQIGFERNKTLARTGHDIYGHKGLVHRRFWKRQDCRNSFKNLFCWINFPRCIPADDLTLPTCMSACENFFRTCKYHKTLWRCGKSKWFNGYAPEAPTIVGGNITYMREYFPGQPWRKNKYSLHGSELPICTPAILGSASTTRIHWFIGVFSTAAAAFFLWVL